MTESKPISWRFTPGSDSNYEDNQHITWINVDSPSIGSMCIWHDAGTDAKEATDRAHLVARAPDLLAENERLRDDLRDADKAVLNAAAEMGALRAENKRLRDYRETVPPMMKTAMDDLDAMRERFDKCRTQLAELREAAQRISDGACIAEGHEALWAYKGLDKHLIRKLRVALADTEHGKGGN